MNTRHIQTARPLKFQSDTGRHIGSLEDAETLSLVPPSPDQFILLFRIPSVEALIRLLLRDHV
jgi:hypothetical protein